MKLKGKFLLTFLIVFTLTFLLACGQHNSIETAQRPGDLQTDNQTLTIDTFSTFPPEIEGCSC